MPTINQYSKQTQTGEQLTIYFSATYDSGVSSSDIVSITGVFKDSSNTILEQVDLTGLTEVTLTITKDQSIRSEITYATSSQEYTGIAHYALTRYAKYKRSVLIERNELYRTNRVDNVLAITEPMIQDAVFIHSQGKRIDFDTQMTAINKILDAVIGC